MDTGTEPTIRRYVEPAPNTAEIPLLGGDVTEGVVRVGDTVRRPAGDHSRLVRTVLEHLEVVGFGGAPRFLGVDGQNRDVLSYQPGEVAGRPWPTWVADPRRAESVARLVRAYDDAMAPLGIPEYVPAPTVVAGMPGLIELERPFLGHRDITPENTVFAGGIATALIDFDLVQPSAPVEEVCNLLLWWAPLMPAADRQRALAEVDPFERTGRIVAAYGLDAHDRELIVPVAQNHAARSWFAMRYRAERFGGGWARMWDEGIGDAIERRQAWLAEHGERLADAVS